MIVSDWLGADNTLGIDIWHRKYQRNNEDFEQWLDRVSAGDEEVKQLIREKKFLFGGRILANRGLTGKRITYSNCYVITPPEDNLESIYETCGKLARTYSTGGGCGIDISNLAPRGAHVNNAADTSSGAVSFMDTFSQVTGQIGQGGRRGALMISLRDNHPDLEEFLDCKLDLSKVNYANTSVMVSDAFMEAVEAGDDWELRFTRQETGEQISKVVKARDIFHKLAENNWRMGEPGCLFWSRISNYNLVSNDLGFAYAGTNPCAEEPLPAGGSCLLGSINLSEFIKDGDFDFTGFIGVVRIAVRALNKVLDEGQPKHPLVEQRDSVRDWRQIGLGVMGIADLLIKLGIRYGSEEAIDYCDAIGEVMAVAAIDESCRLAEQFGAYPRCSANAVLESEYCMRHTTGTMVARIGQYGLRNSQLLTIAPTGTLSTMLGISGGIEPIFATHYTRTTKSLHGKDVTYKVYTPVIKQWIDEHGTEELPDYIVTAQTLDFHERIKMQAVWQKHIDAAISSTVNVPNNFTVEQTEELYMEAWKAGLKGITMFRDGCERAAILNTGNTKTEEVGLKRGEIEPTSDKLIGRKTKLTTGCGSLHVAAYFDPDTKDLKEIYLAKGSTGGCLNFANGLSRMISLSARAGVSITDIVEQLKSAGTCPSYAVRRATKGDTSLGSCCPVAIANALMDMWADVKGTPTAAAEEASNGAKCPQCGGELVHEMGCVTCVNCGYSKCG